MVFDINLTEQDLEIKNGDFVIDKDVTNSLIERIIISNKGDFKQFPFLGVGISNFLQSDASEDQLKREIEKQLELDGVKIKTLKISGDNIKVIGVY